MHKIAQGERRCCSENRQHTEDEKWQGHFSGYVFNWSNRSIVTLLGIVFVSGRTSSSKSISLHSVTSDDIYGSYSANR
jgi:hypothetical protein